MEKEFVSYEIALKLKELGFDEECYGVFVQEKGNMLVPISNIYYTGCTLLKHIKAPLWQQAIDWLNIEKGLFIHVNKSFTCYNYQIYQYDAYEDRNNIVVDNYLDDYYYKEVYELAILDAIDLCKK